MQKPLPIASLVSYFELAGRGITLLCPGSAVALKRCARQLRLDSVLRTLRQLLDQLGQIPLKVPGKAVEPISHGRSHVERDARQVVTMALAIAPLPFRTAHRHSEALSLSQK
jgi:hypothetical protein